jgi:hypothetical protein
MVYGTRFEDQTALRIRDLHTGDERWLAFPVQKDDQESQATLGVLPNMSFTPDSKSLIVFYGGKINKIPINGEESSIISFSVNEKIEIGPELKFDYEISDDELLTISQIRDISLSPDRKHLAFTALNKLYTINLEDNSLNRLTNFDDEITEAMPKWIPDGI